MCREKWYRYTCGHLIAARDDQDGFERCNDWVEGLDETECANYDEDDVHATEWVDAKCQECEYPSPPDTSSDEDGEQ